MYFFDSEFLGQYLDQGTQVKVFVDSEYYTIADRTDLESESYGIGYDLNGKPHTFDYRAIEQIKAGGSILTIDQLQDKISGQDTEADAEVEEPSGDGEPEADTGGGMKPPTGGEGGGEAPEFGAEEPAPEEDEEEPAPPRESIYYQNMVMNMLRETTEKKVVAPNGLSIGDFVENVDRRCEFHGSRGSVTDIILPEKNGGMTEVEYRIFNLGYNFKPGQKVTKPLSQLRRIGNDE